MYYGIILNFFYFSGLGNGSGGSGVGGGGGGEAGHAKSEVEHIHYLSAHIGALYLRWAWKYVIIKMTLTDALLRNFSAYLKYSYSSFSF